MFHRLLLTLATALIALVPSVRAEEGMWTFDNFPLASVNKAYGTKLDQAWLDHVRNASVRLNSGCSASLVSPEGLVMTNQHCVMTCIQSLSSADTDYVAEGFLAPGRDDEMRCEGMAAEILTGISDVTQDINAAAHGLTGDDYLHAVNTKSTQLEMAACGVDRLRHCQVVSLYQGGQYKLYTFRKYSDLRLVFTPEFQMAFFGGDPDNFNFPRYALDVAFLRLYEDGRQVTTPNHLRWRTAAPAAGDAIFVSGNPGKTERLMTAAELESQRDIYLPMTQMMTAELRGRLIGFSAQSDEHKRIATDPLFEVENAFKYMSGLQLALRDPQLFTARRRMDARLQASLNGAFKTEIADPWADIARAQADYRRLFVPYYMLEKQLNHSTLFRYARLLVRGAAEREKLSADRLPEYADSRLPNIEYDLLTPTPIDKPLEQLYLDFSLSKAREYLTADAAQTRLLLGKASPEGLARGLVAGTGLDDVAERQRLWDGGMAAILASDDPMIQYALRIDEASRAVRAEYEDKVTGPTKIANEKIARVRLRVFGTSLYPDATWTPRLSYGRVAGWKENGALVAPFTTFAGLYDRATGQSPYRLSPAFVAAKEQIDGATVLNYTTTNDISGGNSGSPAVDAAGNLVGMVFDGNIHCLGGYYTYDAARNRTIMVSTAAMSEALEKVYHGSDLLSELNASYPPL